MAAANGEPDLAEELDRADEAAETEVDEEIRISHVICHGTRYHQGARRQDMTATETFPHCDSFGSNTVTLWKF